MLTRLRCFIRLHSTRAGLLAAGLLLAGPALAQPTVVGLSPVRNSPAARVTGITVQFSEPLRPGSQQALRLFSAQAGGRLAGVATLSGNQLSFVPATRFKAGEKLWATVDTLARNAAGRALARPQVWQFSVGGGGTGVFTSGSSSLLNTRGRLLLSGDVDGDGDVDALTLNDPLSGQSGQLALRLNSGRGVLVSVADQPLTRVAVAAALADVDEDQDLDLVTLERDPGGNGGFYNVYANDGQGQFGGTGSSSGWLSNSPGVGLGLADLNGDGHLDMFYSCSLPGVGNGAVCVRLNDGRGTFPLQLIHARTGLSTNATVTAADIDNDGDLDVLASFNGAQSVVPFLNGGAGGLLPAPPVTVGGEAEALELADLDLDGDLDLICANYSNTGATVGVRFNNGQGSFGGGFNYPIGLSNSTLPCVAANDLDGDGDVDLLLGHDRNRQVLVRLNNGSGVFRAGTPLTLTQPPSALALADLDDDADVDVVGLGYSQVEWQFNNGPGLPVLQLTAISPVPNRPAGRTATVAATFSAAVSNAPANQLPVYGRYSGRQLGTTTATGSTLTFTPAQPFQAGELLTATAPTGVRSSAGLPLARPAVWQFTAAAGGSGVFTPGFAQVYANLYPRRLRLADLDGDGDLDLVTAFSSSVASLTPPLLVCFNTGAGQFSSPVPLLPGNVQGQGFELADLDGDGDVDFVGFTNTALPIGSPRNDGTVWLNDGRGNFSLTHRLSNSFGDSYAVGDVDGDGDLDVVDGSVHFNDGSGRFSSSGNLTGSSSYFTIRTCTLADLDNDADLDVLTYDETYGTSWFRNDGTGNFSAQIYLQGSRTDDFQLQDLDGDGDLDLLTSSSVQTNDGLGNFTQGPIFASNGAFGAPSELIGDVDGDGDTDALTLLPQPTAGLHVFTNNGRGTFSAANTVYSTNRRLSSTRSASGDVDNDGDLDLVVVYEEFQGVSGWRVFLNRNAVLAARTASAPTLGVWPVPASTGTALQVSLRGHSGAAVAKLYTLTGQVVRSATFSGAVLAVPTVGLPAGTYLLSVEAAAQPRLVRRVVLE